MLWIQFTGWDWKWERMGGMPVRVSSAFQRERQIGRTRPGRHDGGCRSSQVRWYWRRRGREEEGNWIRQGDRDRKLATGRSGKYCHRSWKSKRECYLQSQLITYWIHSIEYWSWGTILIFPLGWSRTEIKSREFTGRSFKLGERKDSK